MLHFSQTVMDHFHNPRNVGIFESPSGEGWAGSPDGSRPFVRMQVVLHDSRIAGARFRTYGCVPAIAASSYLSEWATGQAIEHVLRFTQGELIDRLGGLPAERTFCAELAVEALRAALQDAEDRSASHLQNEEVYNDKIIG